MKRKARVAIWSVWVALPLLVWAAGLPVLSGAAQRMDPDLGVPIGALLQAMWTDAPPAMDGRIEAAWDGAPVLEAALHDGLHGQEVVGSVELRALYDAQRVYLLARWASPSADGAPSSDEAPSSGGGLEDVPPEQTLRNLATVHWRLVDPGEVSGASTGSQGLACGVACHTATANGLDELVGIRAETIPPGLNEDLPAGGGRSDGTWALEWSRARASDNPYDQDLNDPAQRYRFFVKLFLGLEGQPDPVSHVHVLSLVP